jgi:DMSO/TMAO reductase YedYZ molybdopterin-dependent catalytic subunit
MMGSRSSLIGIWLAITSVILLLLVSCSQVTPSPNIQSSAVIQPPPVSDEITPGQATASATPILTYKDLKQFVTSDPSRIDNSGFPITPTEDIHITGNVQDVDIASYHLIVDGLVDNPLTLSYEEILQFAPITKVVLLICPGAFVDNDEWTGVPVKAILAKAGLKPEASQVLFASVDSYSTTLTLQNAQKDGVFLAYKVNGQTLPKEQGYPLRLVREGELGGSWIKWLGHIEVK